jgi:hypothetical protein
VIGDGDVEVLGHLVLAEDLADLGADRGGAGEPVGADAGDEGARRFSVACRRSSRLRARSSARAGLRQAISLSPGRSGEVISARSCSSNSDSWSGPSSAMSLRMAGARSAVTHA